MALINCPECNKEISDKAECCINCGYKLPKKEPMFQGVYCPRCLKASWTKENANKICMFCNTKMKESIYATYDEVHQFCEKHPELKQSPEFSEEAYNKRINYVPIEYGSNSSTRCPYCKSSNCKKIGVVGRSVSVGLFGLASGKVGKQWHCNKCSSDF